MVEEKKNQKVYFIVFVVFVLILLGVLYYFVFYRKDEVEQNNTEEEIAENIEESDEIDMSNWETYENEEYGFSLKYPEGWRIKTENDDNYQNIILINLTEQKEEELQKEFEKAAIIGTDSLPEADYYKIWIRIMPKKENSEIEDWFINEYSLGKDYPIEDIKILDKNGLYVNELNWVPHLIVTTELSENYRIVIDRYLNGNDDNDIKIFKKIITTFKNI